MSKAPFSVTSAQEIQEAQNQFFYLARFVVRNDIKIGAKSIDVKSMFHGENNEFQTDFLKNLKENKEFSAAVAKEFGDKPDADTIIDRYALLAQAYNAALDEKLDVVKKAFGTPLPTLDEEGEARKGEIGIAALEEKDLKEDVIEAANEYNAFVGMRDQVGQVARDEEAAKTQFAVSLLESVVPQDDSRMIKTPNSVAFDENGFVSKAFVASLEKLQNKGFEDLKKDEDFPKQLQNLHLSDLLAAIKSFNKFAADKTQLENLKATFGKDTPLASAIKAFLMWENLVVNSAMTPIGSRAMGSTAVQQTPANSKASTSKAMFDLAQNITASINPQVNPQPSGIFQRGLSAIGQLFGVTQAAPTLSENDVLSNVSSFLERVYASLPNDPLRFPGADAQGRGVSTTRTTTTAGTTTTDITTTSSTGTTTTTSFTQSSSAPTISTVTDSSTSTTTTSGTTTTTTTIKGVTTSGEEVTTTIASTTTPNTTTPTTTVTTTSGQTTTTSTTTTSKDVASTTTTPSTTTTTQAPTTTTSTGTTTATTTTSSKDPSTATTTISTTDSTTGKTTTTSFTQSSSAPTISTVTSTSTTTTTSKDGTTSTTTTIKGTTTSGEKVTTTIASTSSSPTTEVKTTSGQTTTTSTTTTKVARLLQQLLHQQLQKQLLLQLHQLQLQKQFLRLQLKPLQQLTRNLQQHRKKKLRATITQPGLQLELELAPPLSLLLRLDWRLQEEEVLQLEMLSRALSLTILD